MLPIMAMAQSGTVYPIDLSVMMTPPYGPCLKEYVGSDRINIQALLKDFTKNSNQFVVELKVTDNRNRMVLLTHFGDYDFPAGKTFTYPMGPNSTSAQKSNVLHDLFNNAKIKPKDECFEEGAYTFVFQAFDAHSYGSRKVALSMPFTYPVFLQGNTVQPLQIYPYEHEVICNHAFEYTADNGIKKIATQLGGIAYQWQSANPTGMRVGYHVQVVDLGEIAGRTKENIESAAQSSFGITDKYILDRRTYTPFCNHDFTAANYVEDHAYAWRVMAVTGDALDKEASFTDKNAPVRVFYFCGAPGIEKDDYVVVKDERKFDKDLAKVKMDTIKSADLNALAMWRDSSVKDAYCGVNVEIRKKGQDKWTPYFVEKTADFVAGKEPTDNNFNFENLSYNTHYEVRAQYVKCDNCSDRTENCVYAPYSDIMEFVIDQPIDSAVCGDNLPKLADCGEGSEIPKVVAGDIIIANGTEVVVDSVSYPNASDSSIISGTAHLCMPMIKNIQLKMEFEEIQINCAKELVMGRIKSVWDETTCAMIDLDEAGGQNSTGGKDNPSSDATVEPYDPATASSKPSGTLMVDGNKNVMFRTDKDGEVVTIGKFVSFTSSEYQSTNYLADNTHYVEFYNEDKVNNAFDNDQQGYYRNIKNEYEYFDTPHTNVVLPWLANNPGKQKIIKAREVKKKSTSASFESVLFVIPCESGYIQLETTKDANGNYELNIPGLADVASSTPIYAIARTSDETPYFDAGKMMQANYAERTHKLIIVSLIGDLDASYKTEAEKALNSIYGRVGVSWTVELTKFDNDSIKNEILKDGLSIAADDESCWKKETKEMRAIRKLYSESNEIEDNTAYLFVVNHVQEDKFKDTEGDMPRGQAVGYIFKDKVNDAPKFGRLVAHEIGHGVYKLQHTFDYDGLAEKKAQTDNIMDYNTSQPNDFLAHYQWRVMQDSVMFVWGLFQDDEDGMSENKKIVDEIKENVSKSNDKMKFILSKRGFSAISSSKIKGSLQPEYYEAKETINYCGCDVKCVLKHNFDYLKESPFIQIKRNEPVLDESTGKYVYTFYEYVVTYEGPVKTPTYKVNKEKWLKIEINMTNLYLFDAYVFGLEIPVPEIANLRKVISEIEDEEKKAQAYLDLQWVVPYQNQRSLTTRNKQIVKWTKTEDGEWKKEKKHFTMKSNPLRKDTIKRKVKDPETGKEIIDPKTGKAKEEIYQIVFVYESNDESSSPNEISLGDVMCNLTSLATCMQYLGIENQCPDKQYADCLNESAYENDIFSKKDDEEGSFYEQHNYRMLIGKRGLIADKWGAKQITLKDKDLKENYETFKNRILPSLMEGAAIYFSMGAHIIRLVAMYDDYMVVDDPFGCLCSDESLIKRYTNAGGVYCNKKRKMDCCSHVTPFDKNCKTNSRDLSSNKGHNCKWNKTGVDKIVIKNIGKLTLKE